MKKTILLMAMGLLVFVSACKKDESSSEDNTVKQKCYLIEAKSESNLTKIEYSNNLVSKISYYEEDTLSSYSICQRNDGILNKILNYEDDTLKKEQRFTTENNKITTIKYYRLAASSGQMEINTTIKLFYNTDGQLIKRETSNNSGAVYARDEYIWENSNVVETKTYYDINSTGTLELNETSSFTYDDKQNNANGIGIDFTIQALSKNNVLTITVVESQGGISNNDTEFTYEYNQKGYPTKETRVSNGYSSTIDYTYDCD